MPIDFSGITISGGGIDFVPPPPPAPTGFSMTFTNTTKAAFEYNGAVNLTVDWGDGNTENISGNGGGAFSWETVYHTYSSAGTYTINITGTAARAIGTNINQQSGDYANTGWDKLTSINSFGTLGALRYTFESATALVSVPNSIPTSVKAITNMFKDCTSFNDANITNWDTSGISGEPGYFGGFQSAFDGATSFNQNIGNWKTGNVNGMNFMFKNASSFNQDLSSWCVTLIPSAPTQFDLNANAWTGGSATRPQWGTCPNP